MVPIIRSKNLFIAIIVIQFSWYSNSQCNPSSCGSIHSISYPFRLKTDPENCGHPDYQLTCEQNRTVLTLYSQKYYVQAINYHNYTIRLVDPGVQENNACSFPRYNLGSYNFQYGDPYGHNTSRANAQFVSMSEIAVPIVFFSCPFPMKSTPSFVQTNKQCSNESSAWNNTPLYSSGGYTYANLGFLSASGLGISCRVELVTMTSWAIPENLGSEENITVLEIHDALMNGFELSWLQALCQGCQVGLLCYYDEVTNNVVINCGKGKIGLYDTIMNFIENHLLSLKIVNKLGRPLDVLVVYGGGIIIGPRIAIGIPCAIVLLIIKLRRRHMSVFDAIENFLSTENNLLPIRYSYKHIKNMTKGLREKLGEGGFGSVYKGKLRSGREVAVKIISKPKSNGQDFINEVGSLGRIHHVNVVRLIGYCAENSKRALVYDFMPNGSLDKYINQEESLLNWQKKFGIAVGVARGIEYLHQGCDIQILHFDIKPHNILLDENFIPKISDFGLAKLFPTDKSIVTLTAARGTIGYVAPELINRSIGAVSHKADVYSFGMLLMEMLGLKKTPIAEKDESSKYFPSWIYNDMNKGKVIDLREEDEDQKRITKKMTIVGLWCIQTSPIPRPSMSKVVEMLEGDVELLQMPPENFLSVPIVEVDQEHSSMTYSSEFLSYWGNSASSNGLDIIVD